MAICFSAEMKIESNNYNISVFIYFKIENRSLTSTFYFSFYLQYSNYKEVKCEIPFLWFLFKFVNLAHGH